MIDSLMGIYVTYLRDLVGLGLIKSVVSCTLKDSFLPVVANCRLIKNVCHLVKKKDGNC